MHDRVVKLEPPENLLWEAQVLAEEAKKFFEGLDHTQQKGFYDELAAFSRKMLPLLNGEVGRKMQTLLNGSRTSGVPRTVATELHALMYFATGHRSPQQFGRARALLQICVGLPDAFKHQPTRRFA